MIARLTGTVVGTSKDAITLQVGAIGFQVFVPQSLLATLSPAGPETTLYTYLHVRENELSLYGCSSEEELGLFRLLLTVSGIGPKVALSALSFLPADRLRDALAQQDVTTLARIPGLGPKTAQKLVFTLSDKVAAALSVPARWQARTEADADLIAALTGLGYSVTEAQEAIRALPKEPLTFEERLRLVLAHFAP
jgi:holliday junction DNA helicase RuvA